MYYTPLFALNNLHKTLDDSGRTALALAVDTDQWSIAVLLLEFKASFNDGFPSNMHDVNKKIGSLLRFVEKYNSVPFILHSQWHHKRKMEESSENTSEEPQEKPANRPS